MTVTATW